MLRALQDAIDQGWFLLDRCVAAGHPDLGALLATALEVAEALAALHAHGVVHGDLTPSNVLLSSKGDLASKAGRGFVVKVSARAQLRQWCTTTLSSVLPVLYGLLDDPETAHGLLDDACAGPACCWPKHRPSWSHGIMQWY